MTEKFYCVGCKEHYQLPVTEAVKKPSKGDSFRHSVVSSCPKGHKTTKICNKDDYDKYSSSKSAESPLTSGPSPAGGPADITPAGPSATPLERTDAGVPSDFEAPLKPAKEMKEQAKEIKNARYTQERVNEIAKEMVEYFSQKIDTEMSKGYTSLDLTTGVQSGMGRGGVRRPSWLQFIDGPNGREDEEQAILVHQAVANILRDAGYKVVTQNNFRSNKAPDFHKKPAITEIRWSAETFEANEVVGTMSPGAGINAALEPLQGGLENGDEPSLVPADSFQPNGNGHVIGQETDSYNTTPMHAEDDFEPYFELCIISNGTVGDIVGDYDEAEEEKAFKEWEDAVNDGGPHVLIYYDSADADGMIVAGDDFMDVYWDAESESTGSRKAIMATAAAALVLGLVWYRSSRN